GTEGLALIRASPRDGEEGMIEDHAGSPHPGVNKAGDLDCVPAPQGLVLAGLDVLEYRFRRALGPLCTKELILAGVQLHIAELHICVVRNRRIVYDLQYLPRFRLPACFGIEVTGIEREHARLECAKR